MFNIDAQYEVSKQTRSEAGKNKIIIKRISNINKLIINQICCRILQKSTKFYWIKILNWKKNITWPKKTHLATAKNFVLHHSLKINKRGGPSKLLLENGNVLKKSSKKYLISFSFPFNTNIPENVKHHSHQMHLLVYLF